MNGLVENLSKQTAGLPAEELLARVVGRFGDKVALASSMGAADQVITDMLCRVARRPLVFTIDTGRLPQETYDTIEATRKRYGIEVRVLFPGREDLEEMVKANGPNLFHRSVEDRKLCCRVRKVLPLRRGLAGLEAWITGLRREQSVTRADLARIEWDQANGLIRVNPLADWTAQEVWAYVRANGVPYNPLHDRGYPSIGCAPCMRAVAAGEDERSGRWWWEPPEKKECGLHVVDGRLVRRR